MALAAERFAPQSRGGADLLYAACPPRKAPAWPQPHTPAPAPTPDKDYSVPLHVDCSVEYELPECAKPPQGVKVEPLLMIHPAHFRRLDSLRRCPFVNNLPQASAALPFELPPPAEAPRRGRRPNPGTALPDVSSSSQHRRWPPAACCRSLQHTMPAMPALPALPAPPPPQLELFAPKEGDTLENSSFGKCAPRPRHPRHRTHPYAPETGLSVELQSAQNCDKTFDALQGNPLVSPYRAKTFDYQSYPIVMYK